MNGTYHKDKLVRSFADPKDKNKHKQYVEYWDGTKEDADEETIMNLWFHWSRNGCLRLDNDDFVIFGYLEFICDKARHLICYPYSIDNLHLMANILQIDKCWFHKDHYDIPKLRITQITNLCHKVVSSREIVKIIKGL